MFSSRRLSLIAGHERALLFSNIRRRVVLYSLNPRAASCRLSLSTEYSIIITIIYVYTLAFIRTAFVPRYHVTSLPLITCRYNKILLYAICIYVYIYIRGSRDRTLNAYCNEKNMFPFLKTFYLFLSTSDSP